MAQHKLLLVTLGIAAAAIAGCGGGGSGSSLAPATATVPNSVSTPGAKATATSAAMSTAVFTLSLPAASTAATARSPQFVSPNAQSIAITVAAGTASPSPAIVANLTTGSPACSTTTSGLTCTVTVPAPVGSDTFGVTMYAATNATGSVLSSASVTGTVTVQTANVIPITLSGTVASVAVTIPATLTVPGSAPTSVPVVVTAKDASGATIVGAYSTPITLTSSDSTTVTALSATSLASSSSAVALAFTPANGTLPNGGPVTITPHATGATTLTPGTFQYLPVISSVVFTTSSTILQGPAISTAPLTVVAKDATGATITAAPFITPLVITSTDTSGGLTLSAPSFVKPSDSVTITYSGAAATTSTAFSTSTVSTATPTTLAIRPPHQSLFVADGGSIKVFAPGATGNVAPIRNITGANTLLVTPHAVALDAAGDIWATSDNNSILEFAPDAQGNATPIRQITGSATGMTGNINAWGIAFDSSGNIFVAVYDITTYLSGSIIEYAASATGNATPMNVITGTLVQDANSVVLDSSNNLYVGATNPDALVEYAPGANGAATPINNISGSATTLTGVQFQSAFDTSGRLWTSTSVTSTVPSIIRTYAPNVTGNVAPSVELTGTNTTITNVRGLAFDAQNNMYVSQANVVSTGQLDAVAVFAAGASGNVAPIRNITGANTGFSLVRYIAISP